MFKAAADGDVKLVIKGVGFTVFDPIAVLVTIGVYAYAAYHHSKDGRALGVILAIVYLGTIVVRLLNRGAHVVIDGEGIRVRAKKGERLLPWAEITSVALDSRTEWRTDAKGSHSERRHYLCIKTDKGDEEVSLAGLKWSSDELQEVLDHFSARLPTGRRH